MMFSIIIPFYQGTQTDEQLLECLKSCNQGMEVEVLVYHDGSPSRPWPSSETLYHSAPPDTFLIPTEERHDDWGHSLRDIGIKRAKGEYIIHLNADNILYPKVLERLAKLIERTKHKPIYILPVKLMGKRWGGGFIYDGNPKDFVTLRGNPRQGVIDAMQLVMKRELWLEYGGWYDKDRDSDGVMYERFCKDHEPYMTKILMGEHR